MLSAVLRQAVSVAGRNIHRRCLHSASAILQAAKQVEMQSHDKTMKITWENGSTDRYPFVYVRDLCRCSLCRHETSQSRLHHILDMNFDTTAVGAAILDNGARISVQWDDDHVSEFNSDWLLGKRLSDDNCEKPQDTTLVSDDVKPWGNEMNGKITRFPFEQLLNDDRVLVDWLLSMRRDGVTLISGVPCKLGQLERFGEAVGHLRNTYYGITTSTRLKAVESNVAYTNWYLHPHTDLVYFDYSPGIQMMHCLAQVEKGGESTLVDVFKVTEDLRRENPRWFDLITSTPVRHSTRGEEPGYGTFWLTTVRPIIELDWKGHISRIATNDSERREFLKMSVQNVPEVYKAYHRLQNMLRDQKYSIRHKLMPGELVAFDNHRVLHGREAFEVQAGEDRWLELAYFDWDVMRSKTKDLQQKHGLGSDPLDSLW